MSNIYSKIFKNLTANELVAPLDNLSPFHVCLQKKKKKKNNLHHAYISLRWKEKIDENFSVGAALMDISQSFQQILYNSIIVTLADYWILASALDLINNIL